MSGPATVADSARAPSLDALFGRSVARSPDAPALADRDGAHAAALAACGMPPLRLTFAEADRAIAALAGQFRALGLAPGAVVGVQMQNCAQTALTLLALARAGLTASLLPMLWRRADLAEALGACGARALIVAGFTPEDGGGHHALEAAADVFAIRHVCGFGAKLADGIARLDAAEQFAGSDTSDGVTSADGAPDVPAIITFDRMPQGWRAVPRSHAQIVAAGLAVFLESGIAPGARILSALEPMSFAPLACGLVPWLVSGGTLVAADAGANAAIADDLAAADIDVLVAPAPFLLTVGRDRATRLARLKQAIALWRTPEQVGGSADWTHPRAQCVDVLAFGEAGLLAATRTAAGRPSLILPGLQGAPRFRPKATPVGEAAVSAQGTLLLRGPMIAAEPYAKPAFGDAPQVVPDTVDTGYRARVDARSGGIVVTAPPAGLVAIGGCRFFSRDVEALGAALSEAVGDTQLAALPDRANGHRLLGRTRDPAALRAHLAEAGAHALIADAFRERHGAVPKPTGWRGLPRCD